METTVDGVVSSSLYDNPSTSYTSPLCLNVI
ncbi:unnamed protein product, partial [Rotaria magnacalcarata]